MKTASLITVKNFFVSRLRDTFVFLLCFFVGACLLAYPQNAKESISQALKICGETVIASLFPFMFLSSFMIQYGLTGSDSKLLRLISEKLFGMCPESISVFFLSALGGFPVGAKMTKSLIEKNSIDGITAQRLIFSCINPSPSFAVTAVGLAAFGNAKTGIIIYSSVVAANLLMLFLSQFILGRGESASGAVKNNRSDFSSAFTSAGKSASEAIISVCGYVLLFSCLCDILNIFLRNAAAISALSGLLEVTVGCKRLAATGNVPLMAGIIGWGGLSVHFQIMDCVESSGLKLRLFFASRAVCAFLSVFICDALLKIFPTVMQTVSLRNDVIIRQTEKSIPVSIMMLLACFVFLIGDCTVKIGNSPSKQYGNIKEKLK